MLVKNYGDDHVLFGDGDCDVYDMMEWMCMDCGYGDDGVLFGDVKCMVMIMF